MFNMVISPATQAKLFAASMTWLVVVGICTSVLLLFGLIWVVVQACALLIRSMLEALQTVSLAFSSVHPFIQLLLLVGAGYLAYLIIRWRMSR